MKFYADSKLVETGFKKVVLEKVQANNYENFAFCTFFQCSLSITFLELFFETEFWSYIL
jgi:hypothetical protein